MFNERRLYRFLLGSLLGLTGLMAFACSSTKRNDESDAGGQGSSDAAAPYLMNLSVTGGGPLTPAFSPDVNDYYVTCAAGANNLAVLMTAAPGDVCLLANPASLAPISKSAPTQTVSVSIQPNDAIVAVAEDPSTTAEVEYWVRCLPPDLPPIVATRHSSADTLPPGYYMTGTLFDPVGIVGYAMIVNQNGVPVWYVRQAGGHPVLDVDEVVPGSISFSFQAPTTSPPNPTPNTPFTVINPDSPTTTTTLAPIGYNTDDHDLQSTADGNYVVIAYLETPGIDLTGLTDPSGNALGPNSTIVDCAVVEFEPSGQVLFSWVASEHFDAAKVTTSVDAAYQEDSGIVYDVFHCNSVDVDPSNGDYLISSRQMDSIFYVENKPPGTVLWKLGGNPFSKDASTIFVSISEPKDAFHAQHDARLIKGWEPSCNGGTGQVSVFDDETAPTGSGSARGAVYNVVVGSSGTSGCTSSLPDGGASQPGTATLVLSYMGMAASDLGGSVRFYDDGSRVVSWGLTIPSTNQLLTEFDDKGNDLLDLNFAANSISATYRGLKIPLSAFDINALRKTAGQ
jgi:hypothetical protein